MLTNTALDLPPGPTKFSDPGYATIGDNYRFEAYLFMCTFTR